MNETQVFKLDVTDQHIQDGIRRVCRSCPVALAIQSTLIRNRTSWRDIRVGAERIVIELRHERWYSELVPHAVAQFIDQFDRGLTVEPFSAELVLVKAYAP